MSDDVSLDDIFNGGTAEFSERVASFTQFIENKVNAYLEIVDSEEALYRQTEDFFSEAERIKSHLEAIGKHVPPYLSEDLLNKYEDYLTCYEFHKEFKRLQYSLHQTASNFVLINPELFKCLAYAREIQNADLQRRIYAKIENEISRVRNEHWRIDLVYTVEATLGEAFLVLNDMVVGSYRYDFDEVMSSIKQISSLIGNYLEDLETCKEIGIPLESMFESFLLIHSVCSVGRSYLSLNENIEPETTQLIDNFKSIQIEAIRLIVQNLDRQESVEGLQRTVSNQLTLLARTEDPLTVVLRIDDLFRFLPSDITLQTQTGKNMTDVFSEVLENKIQQNKFKREELVMVQAIIDRLRGGVKSEM